MHLSNNEGFLPLVGGIWQLYLLGYLLSAVSAAGSTAPAGISAEFSEIMLRYLNHAWEGRLAAGRTSAHDLIETIRDGAVLRYGRRR